MLFCLLICIQIKSQNSLPILDSSRQKIEINSLPNLKNIIPDTARLVKVSPKIDSIKDVTTRPTTYRQKKKVKKRPSKEQQLIIKEKLKWEKVLEQQNKLAVENYLKSSDGTNTYLIEAGKKLEDFKIIKTDTFLFDKSVNYTFEFKGTENKAPSILSKKLDQISIKERNANFIIINTDYAFSDTITFLVEGSAWKKIPIFVSKPLVKTSFIKEEKGTGYSMYLFALGASLLALWFFRYIFNEKKTPTHIEKERVIDQRDVSSNRGITIEKIGKRNNTKSEPTDIYESTFLVPLYEFWDDTAIHNCHFEKNFIEELQYFLFGLENKNKVETVELGGFILGTYQLDASGFYSVNCTKFVGIQSEKEDLYKMGFGSKAWIALEEVMHSDKYKGLDLIGWFHTHPGHGVFLSKPDLNICNNIFPEPYQFAMVMDTIKSSSNEKYHVGLFTKKVKGEMNNVKDKKADFIQWQDVVQKII